MQKPLRLLVLPGDGIGPEISRATCSVLERLSQRMTLELELYEARVGFAAIEEHGNALPPEVVDVARAADGVILGPVSTHAYPPPHQGGVNPSSGLRVGLDVFANIRPACTRKGVPAVARKMDLVIVRENTEGFYADRNMVVGSGEFQPTEDVALAVRKITTAGSERIAQAAFELAQRRRRRLTAVHKANVLRVSDGLFLRVVRQVAARFSDVAYDELIVDAMAARLVRTPADFDVILATNLYGDILSDEAAELAGGLGLAAALNVGSQRAIAQATHGSAPDIAGQNKANPAALILSAGMLLEWLASRHQRADLREASQALHAAVDRALADSSKRTPDVGGSGSTSGFAEAVCDALG